jgi:colanic acid/amylovoran biosynthesis glycosyltransferase
MSPIAYIANQFPSPVEPYVMEEIRELRRRGVEVIPCSARLAKKSIEGELKSFSSETIYLEPLRFGLLFSAAWMCFKRRNLLLNLMLRVLLRGKESPGRRMRALLHTLLGAYYALLLRGRGAEHIHVHHGYFASWIALVAARLLGISFSMTLHGSDLLLHPHYLETKLKYCKFCITISEFNRRHILERYPECDPDKVLLQRLGVDSLGRAPKVSRSSAQRPRLVMLAVGRLHPVKNHEFLLQASRRLKDRGIDFVCQIAGDGGERPALELLRHGLGLQAEVRFLGHLSRLELHECYEKSDLVVLTSRSEGVPIVLMEAMAHGRTVLAPAITGIPELVCDGETGFLYRPGSLEDFVSQVERISKIQSALAPMHEAARRHVLEHFNREKNLTAFGENFLSQVAGRAESKAHENSVLQQI